MMKKLLKIILLVVNLSGQAVLADEGLLENERNTIEIFQKTSPLVVNVHNIQTVITNHLNLLNLESGTGSGFIWDRAGHIVTNYHVVKNANKVKITVKEKTVLAKIVGVAPKKDIAVLQIEDKTLLAGISSFVEERMADSSKLQVGQKTLAIGNPFGLDQSLTTGVVSALGRQIPGIGGLTIHDMIQTDASINPGNSGGPLLNSRGELIGMNTIIFSSSGSSAGVGFAVPANDIKKVVSQILRYGRVIQPGLGVEILPDSIADQLGVRGVIIARVPTGSHAALAGLKGIREDAMGQIQLGDIIIGIDEKIIQRYDDLYNALEGKQIGTMVNVSLLRNDKKEIIKLKTIEVTGE